MALLLDKKIDLAVCWEDTVDVARKQKYLIHKSGLYTNYQPTVTTSWSNQNINFNVILPSTDTIIDPYMIIRVTF